MRCFISVDLNEDIKDYLFELQKRIKYAKIKWVAKKNLHLTIKFLGGLNKDKLNFVKEKLNGIKFNKFKVKLNNIGVFPDEKFIRIVWIGLNPEDKLKKLQQEVDGELLEMFPDEQKFISHLTLGRVKIIKDKKKFIESLKDIKVEKKEFEINSFNLMKSVLSKDGPRYEILEVYTLE